MQFLQQHVIYTPALVPHCATIFIREHSDASSQNQSEACVCLSYPCTYLITQPQTEHRVGARHIAGDGQIRGHTLEGVKRIKPLDPPLLS